MIFQNQGMSKSYNLKQSPTILEFDTEDQVLLCFGHEPSWSRYLGWSVGWSVCLSQHKFQNKQSHCRTIFLLAGLSFVIDPET